MEERPFVRKDREAGRNLIGRVDSLVDHLQIVIGRPESKPAATRDLLQILGVVGGAMLLGAGLMRIFMMTCH